MLWWPIGIGLIWLADPSLDHPTAWTADRVAGIQAACAEVEHMPAALVGEGLVVCLHGRTDARMRDTFLALTEDRIDGVAAVHVVSEGGSLSAALDIAEPIAAAGLPVIAGGICVSACAQFIFMAGSPKVIAPGGVVAMHGGALKLERLMGGEFDEAAERSLLRESLRFYEFYDRLNVDIDIVKTPPDSIADRLAAGEIVFWSVLPEEYPAYGVTDLIVIPQPAEVDP